MRGIPVRIGEGSASHGGAGCALLTCLLALTGPCFVHDAEHIVANMTIMYCVTSNTIKPIFVRKYIL